MIHFVTLLAHRKTHDLLVGELVRRGDVAVSLQDYTVHPERFCRPNDVVVLCDVERFEDPDLESLSRYARRCRRHGARVLNEPSRAMRRRELVQTLAQTGNGFRAWRASQTPSDMRFPVFIRDEFEHKGPATELLFSVEDVAAALRKHDAEKSADREALVVEFLDTKGDDDSRYHKYGAFIVDGVVVPRHLFYAKSWVVKRPDAQTEQDLEDERSYLTHNHHAAQVAEACRRGGIDYGRVDFAARADGSITVFEINTNPTVFHLDDFHDGPRRWVTETFYMQLVDGLRQCASPTEASATPEQDVSHA